MIISHCCAWERWKHLSLYWTLLIQDSYWLSISTNSGWLQLLEGREKQHLEHLISGPDQKLPDRRVTVGVRDDVHDGPAGHGGGDLPHHLSDLLPLGVSMPVLEEDTGPGYAITAIKR